jgi:hypothetical protein
MSVECYANVVKDRQDFHSESRLISLVHVCPKFVIKDIHPLESSTFAREILNFCGNESSAAESTCLTRENDLQS